MIDNDGVRRWTPRRQALLGALLWSGWVAAARPSWTAALLVLSPLTLVPLGLGLGARPENGPFTPALDRLRLLSGPAAALAALSFTLEPGAAAASLTLPWLVTSMAIGLVGVGRLLSRRRLEATVAVDAGLAYLTVGAAWLTISRAGARPLGFDDRIVELTAVHFHYAGFALPIVAGLVATRLVVPAWVVIGVAATAAGITAGGTAEWLGASLLALAGLATAVLLARHGRCASGLARVLLLVAAAALSTGMCLAMGWAWSSRFGWTYLDLAGMARWHGTLNAIGFGAAGLIGLTLARPGWSATNERVAIRIGRPSSAHLLTLQAEARCQVPTSPVGLLRRPLPTGYRRDQWTRVLPCRFDEAQAAVRSWAGHRAAGMAVTPPPTGLAVGETVALAIPVGPLAVTATARIVDVVDEPGRFGFTYATLPHHPEDGEESFVISVEPDGGVRATIEAVWRAQTFAARCLPPLTRLLQRRAIGRYLDGFGTAREAARPGPTH